MLTGMILVVEIIGGVVANSLALLSDAGHLFADLMAIGFSLAAMHLASLPANPRKTFGYHRAEVIAAILNGLSLLAISAMIFWEAYQRLATPPEVKSLPMLIVAVVGLGVNLWILLMLNPLAGHSLNVRSAFLHVMGDMLASVGVIVGAIVIILTGNHLADPLISILIGLIIIRGAYGVLRDAINILLEGAPEGLDLPALRADILATPGVTGLTDLHVWTLSSNNIMLMAHLNISADSPHAGRDILERLKSKFSEKYGIHHTTIQLECDCCSNLEEPNGRKSDNKGRLIDNAGCSL